MFPVPQNEAERMGALREVEILDTPAEQIYDDIVALASAICRTPIAVVNFIDEDRQWGKALVGLASSEAPRDASFCARTIVAEDGMFVVPDTALDPDWSENAMVLGEPNLRFYAGAAIVVDGNALGTVCVADREARDLAPEQLEALKVLSRQTAAALELRMKTKQLEAANSGLRRMAVEDALTGLANRSLLFDRLGVARASAALAAPLGVVFGDLDGFKAVNDRLGHHAGDGCSRSSRRGSRAWRAAATPSRGSPATSSSSPAPTCRRPRTSRRSRSGSRPRGAPARRRRQARARASASAGRSPRTWTTRRGCCTAPTRRCTPPSARAAAPAGPT